MPIGTGNDLSRGYSMGAKISKLSMDSFIKRLMKDNLLVRSFDVWEVQMKNSVPCLTNPKASKKLKKYKTKNFTKAIMLYMGIGYDANIVYSFENLRRKFPLLMVAQKVSRIYFAIIFIFWAARAMFKTSLHRLFMLFSASSTIIVDTNIKQIKEEAEERDKSQVLMPRINNMILLNNKFRAGGMFNEWGKSRRAALHVDGKDIILKQRKDKTWYYERDLYTSKSNFMIFTSKSL